MDFLSTFLIVLLIIVLAVPGFVLRKVKLFGEKAAAVLAVLLLYVSQPSLMISSLLGERFEASLLVNFAWVFGFAVVLQLFVYFAAKLIFLRAGELPARRVCVASSYLGNVGFMGIPVMQMLFPGNGALVLYAVVFNVAFNAMAWTLGIYAVTGMRKAVRPLKILLNPPTVATVVALPFFFCNVQMPEQILTVFGYLGDMTLPLSMIILGVRLADVHLCALFGDWKVYLTAAVKLLVSPLLSLGILVLVDLLVPLDTYVMIALFIIAAMPTASSVLNFAERYGGDCDTAACTTLMTTVLCVVTIPVLMLLCSFL